MKIITALITPFTNNLKKINYEILDNLIEYQINYQADGIVIGGTTGERSTLRSDELDYLYTYVTLKFGSLIDIYLNVGTNNTIETIELIEKYNHLNCRGFLIVVPYYNCPSQAGLYEHFALIASKTEKEIFIYNVPKRTGTSIDIDTIKLLSNFKNICKIKDASTNIERLKTINDKMNIELFIGNDTLYLWGLASNINGIVSVMSNIELPLMKEAFLKKREFNKCLKEINRYGNPVGIKKYMYSKGIEVEATRLPLYC